MKILNLYAGIGGNRKLWTDVEVTAVEMNPKISSIYQDFFPQDKVIVADAHAYLLEHFEEYEFIWSSPPCPTHSRVAKAGAIAKTGKINYAFYPDMKLYEEILLLKHYFKGKWVVENVISFYEPLIRPSEIDSHYYWSNFHIGAVSKKCREHHGSIETLMKRKGFDISKYVGIDKRQVLRNCVEPEVGLHILNYAKKNLHQDLFQEQEVC